MKVARAKEVESAVRKRLSALLVMVVLAVGMLVGAAPAFAQPGGSEDSCGASNPEFGQPPSKERTLGTCGVRINPNYPEKPEAPFF
jgi:hypothetical protein